MNIYENIGMIGIVNLVYHVFFHSTVSMMIMSMRLQSTTSIIKPFSLNNSDLIFHPFEMNDADHNSPLCKIDLDLCFYNSIDFDLSHCNYYDEDGFIQIINKMNTINQLFSLCHFNIRSMKHNLSQFEIYMKSLELNFCIIALSETWLQDDTCELYCLDGYDLFEKHRTSRQGGGVYSSDTAFHLYSGLTCAI